ncbi:unnamed protein product [Trichogramma brassicae]|uniref:Uncharacterized protein n=1 Tax=Trichogramma brassicae TaxID=86971 RepID=A0A6H5HTS6_9HYME|nr:unnamed protein product [Trichogramma brassicae]
MTSKTLPVLCPIRIAAPCSDVNPGVRHVPSPETGAAKVWRHLEISRNKRRKKIKNLISDVFFYEESNARLREAILAQRRAVALQAHPHRQEEIRGRDLRQALNEQRFSGKACQAVRVRPGYNRIVTVIATH